MNRSVRLLAGAVFCAVLSGPVFADVQVYGGVGGLTAFDEDLRAQLGSAFTLDTGVSSHFSERASLFLEAAAAFNSGREIAFDPTFEMEETDYRHLSVTLGVRTDLVQRADVPLRVHLGAGWHTVFIRREEPGRPSETSPAQGLALELLPQYRMGDAWFLWARQRVLLLSDTRFDSTFQTIEPSGSWLEIGLGFRFRSASPEESS